MSNIMSNPDISPSRVAQYVQGQLVQVEGALQFMQDLNNLDLAEFTLGPQGFNYVEPEPSDPDYEEPAPTPPPPSTPSTPSTPRITRDEEFNGGR